MFRRKEKARMLPPLKKNDTKREYIDLEQYDVKGDVSLLKVKVIDVDDPSDMEKVTPFIGHGDVLFVNLSKFQGDSQDFDRFIESMRSQARSTKYKLFDAGNGYFVVSPDDAAVKRL